MQYQDQRRKDVQMVNARGIQTLKSEKNSKEFKGCTLDMGIFFFNSKY